MSLLREAREAVLFYGPTLNATTIILKTILLKNCVCPTLGNPLWRQSANELHAEQGASFNGNGFVCQLMVAVIRRGGNAQGLSDAWKFCHPEGTFGRLLALFFSS